MSIDETQIFERIGKLNERRRVDLLALIAQMSRYFHNWGKSGCLDILIAFPFLETSSDLPDRTALVVRGSAVRTALSVLVKDDEIKRIKDIDKLEDI